MTDEKRKLENEKMRIYNGFDSKRVDFKTTIRALKAIRKRETAIAKGQRKRN